MAYEPTTIAAIASPPGACARIVLRISGPQSHALVQKLLASPAPAPLPTHGVARVMIQVEHLTASAVALLFADGKSYTGEPSAELHVPGNPLWAKMVLHRLYELGAKPADPGEYTARAFFNGRLDLAEAEGVAATINAQSQRELDAARRLQSGELSRRLAPMMDELAQTLALVEAGIDFSEEDITFISAQATAQRAGLIVAQLEKLLADSSRFERLTHEPQIVLCGKPNAGKSTLLNCLCRRQRAVVSSVAGTTRDMIWAHADLNHGRVRIVDTAGLEATSASDAATSIPGQMQQKALQAIAQADVVVLVRESADAADPAKLHRPPDLVVVTKCDLRDNPIPNALPVSAQTGAGIDPLRRRLDELAFGSAGNESLALTARHLRQIELAADELRIVSANTGAISPRDRVLPVPSPAGIKNPKTTVDDTLHSESKIGGTLPQSPIAGDNPKPHEPAQPAHAASMAAELTAVHLRYALDALGEITGIVSPDEVLARVFATFCVGK